ncbi:DUF3143 domain-containing protein [Nodosilinea sp. LEGE 07088]|uniref:DUF3143 domain-containing protein n=1 Tax=Nodosilinea sp. LEGE 07088 TaxID=2777968 RepID=UPI0018827E14|nr:DUF3143 domain-containing protein [Nodosilinea sp. LEGE 07088]MBE9135971.1 DUF3143 domain-containing protein [Nodosilinea sp. LEGE 07088]
MALPSATTPLYNHPLPDIEAWLRQQGCTQNSGEMHCWHTMRPGWEADIVMETDCIMVRYIGAGADGKDVQRVFKYSLSRQDLEEAIFSGP